MLSQSMLVMPGAQMEEQFGLGRRMLHCNARGIRRGTLLLAIEWQAQVQAHQDLAETQRELNILST
jgi:hypothetical protein